jgi:hypothetical protein
MTKIDEICITKMIRLMKYEDTVPVRRIAPLTSGMVDTIISRTHLNTANPGPNLKALSRLIRVSMEKSGVEGLMRGGEITSGIRAYDVDWDYYNETVTILLHRTKTVRAGGGVKVTLVRNANPHCSYNLLLSLWNQLSLDRRPNSLLFPEISRGLVRNVPVSASTLRKYIKEDVAKLGLNPDRYAMHSLRAGGATDLFNMNVPYHIIKDVGRWKSDTALIYYRGDREKIAAVGKAFGAIYSSRKR